MLMVADGHRWHWMSTASCRKLRVAGRARRIDNILDPRAYLFQLFQVAHRLSGATQIPGLIGGSDSVDLIA